MGDEQGTAVMPPAFVVPALVVRHDVVDALQDAWVDNIDYYSAVLVDRLRDGRFDGYFVANVIGSLASRRRRWPSSSKSSTLRCRCFG